jgi:large subunit ribosomal protein L10
VKSKRIPQKKTDLLNKLIETISNYNVIAVANLHGVRSSQIQEMRKRLRGKVKMLVAKNTIFKKACENLEGKKRGIVQFANSLAGSNLFLFTNMNPFALAILLDKSKVRVPAKAGDIAKNDIIVPAGNTGLPPGPIISEFSEVKIPTKIESGSIWIPRDTIVARKGDVISAKLASALSRLGIKPVEAGLSLISAYDEGLILSQEDLKLDLNEFKARFEQAAYQAVNLAVNASYVAPETASLIISKAHRQALLLSVKAEYPSRDTVQEIIRNAYAEMLALSMKIASINKAAAPEKFQ